MVASVFVFVLTSCFNATVIPHLLSQHSILLRFVLMIPVYAGVACTEDLHFKMLSRCSEHVTPPPAVVQPCDETLITLPITHVVWQEPWTFYQELCCAKILWRPERAKDCRNLPEPRPLWAQCNLSWTRQPMPMFAQDNNKSVCSLHTLHCKCSKTRRLLVYHLSYPKLSVTLTFIWPLFRIHWCTSP